MKTSTSIESFRQFAAEYAPFPWELNEDTHQKDVQGKHSVLVSLVRYWYVLAYLETLAGQGKLR